MNFRERVFGCLAGLTLGDALGMLSEFMTPEEIQKEYTWLDKLQRVPAWHPHSVMTPGEVTDDTRQALAVAHAYDDEGRFTPEAVARELIAWKNSDDNSVRLCIGPSTKEALEKLASGVSPSEAGINGKTNGAAMRAAVIGLLNAGNAQSALEEAVIASLPTHGTGVAISGAAAVACAVAEAATGTANLTTILEAAKWGAREGKKKGVWIWSTALETRIELAERIVGESKNDWAGLNALYKYVGTDMYVPESVAAAFGVLLLAKGDPMMSVLYGANIGGDTDTVASIAGAICGAWKGIDTLDMNMVSQVEKVNGLDLGGEANRLVEIAEKKKHE